MRTPWHPAILPGRFQDSHHQTLREKHLADKVHWEREAEETLEKVVAQVPFLFRSRARSATSERAVQYASEAGATSVTTDHVIIAVILITPPSYRDGLRRQFEKHAICLDRYEEFFSR
jgi:hypothetical protein